MRDKVRFIDQEKTHTPVTVLCAVLGISRQSYYQARQKTDKDLEAFTQIHSVFEASRRTYGIRRIEEGLKQEGIRMNHKKIQRLMAKYHLHPHYLKKKPWRSYRRVEENVKHDLVKRHFHPEAPKQIWTTDITYLILKGRKAYLSSIRDLATGNIVSYKISHRNDNQLVLDTLKEAIKTEKSLEGLILHSDQGFQYTSWAYKNVCQTKGIRISMSRKGTPIDNSPQESWHAILKKETLYNNHYATLEDYIQGVIEWIQFYNTDRIRL